MEKLFRGCIWVAIAIVIMGTFAACSQIAGTLPSIPQAQDAAPAGIMAAVQTSTQITPPTIAPTATPDALKLEQARAELAAAQANEQAAKVRLDMAVRDAAETAVFYDSLHAQETERAQVKASATADAVGRATQAQYSLFVQATSAGNATATAQAPIDERNRKVAEMMPDVIAAATIIVSIIALVLTFFGTWLIWEKIQNERQWRLEPVAEDPEPAQVASVPPFAGTAGRKISTAALCRETGIDAVDLRDIAYRISSGEAFVHDNFTPRTNGLSEGKFSVLQYSLAKYDLAKWNNADDHSAGMTILPDGLAWIAELTGVTTPPPAQDAQEAPPAAQTDR